MSKLRKYITSWFSADEAGAVKYVNLSVRLVKVGKHWWDGRRKMTDGVVQIGEETVGDDAATRPSWKLVPKELRSQFQNFGKSVDAAVSDYCITRTVVGNESRPLVFGSGVYAVDASMWPTLQSLMALVQAKWGEAADYWCSDEGYRHMHEKLKEQVGEKDYAHIEKLVPKREALRRRFWLQVDPLPFRLSEEVSDGTETEVRAEFVADLIEATVRVPREEAAAVWKGVAAQLVAPGSTGGLEALRPVRKNADGTSTVTARRLRGPSVVAAHRALSGLKRGERYHDPDLVAVAAALSAELTDNESVASNIATRLNSDDADAERVGRLLVAAADVAADESRMCAGVGAVLPGIMRGATP